MTITDRFRGALWGMFVGDALAMPVHWYYNVAALQRDFGTIRDYQAPKDFHPSSIMALASTGRAGRGDQHGEVVGRVILKGKKPYWGRPNTHYHQGMRPGDNALNLHCARVLIRAMNAAGHYDPADFLRDYIAFMTAPDSHNDTYQQSDRDVIGRLLSPACYIDQSFPSVLYLAARYANDFEAALIANTNVGGDNCHRGAVLGAILGAALGFQAIPERWIHGLQARRDLENEIDTFIARFAEPTRTAAAVAVPPLAERVGNNSYKQPGLSLHPFALSLSKGIHR
ncbi:MAG: ADP-ribosylglycohydrolase family protein [Synechococcaceae cyanobacterium SM1_2_3]|nr:ADP-ribosylglycohydrolase family protein [Synechococcaceae cyanobacterium SM1_2_3]